MFKKNITKYKNFKKGFTLIEMLMVVSIFAVITSTVLTSHSKFSGNLLLGSLAYDVALSIRQAQVFGLSVREVSVGSGVFNVGYGVHFDNNLDTSYILFADLNDNSEYDGPNEIVEVFNINNKYRISDLCGLTPNGTTCVGGVSTIDIVFKRPDPDAIISSNTGVNHRKAEVILQSPSGKERKVSIWTTGQISVEQ